MIYNPYDGVSFSSQILGISHAHCVDQTQFETLYDGGIRHFAISNYYPSAPCYPLSDNFSDVPNDAISSSNAEFARMTNITSHCHLNGLGSTFSAGTAEDTSPHTTWQVLMDNVLSHMMYEDAGGITINHPVWSGLSFDEVCDLFDYDERVLGIEIYNHSCEVQTQNGWATSLWDEVLKTGRVCFGFAVPDHGAQYQSQWPWYGMNVLLSQPNDEDCLKAYRSGAFYSRLKNTELKFSSISVNKYGRVTVRTENADSITFVVNGTRHTVQGNSAEYVNSGADIYCRVEAEGLGDKIFSNPVVYRVPKRQKENGFFFTY